MAIWTERLTGTGNSISITNGRAEAVRLLWAHLIYTTSATVGNRQIKMSLLDTSSNTHNDTHAGGVQAASLTRHFNFMPGTFRETAFVADELHVPFPEFLIVPAGWSLVVEDSAAISAADTYALAWQWGSL